MTSVQVFSSLFYVGFRAIFGHQIFNLNSVTFPADGFTSVIFLTLFSQFFYAAYDFEGSGMHMLSVKSGQIVLVLQQQDIQGNPEWWFVEDRFGEKGYVPGNYLRKYEQ